MEIEKFNHTIDSWIRELSKFDLNYLLIKPDEKSWSLGQLYEHIIEETNWYIGQIEIALADQENANQKTSEEARTLLARGSFENKRFQGDPLIAEHVKQPESLEKLKSDFEKLNVKQIQFGTE